MVFQMWEVGLPLNFSSGLFQAEERSVRKSKQAVWRFQEADQIIACFDEAFLEAHLPKQLSGRLLQGIHATTAAHKYLGVVRPILTSTGSLQRRLDVGWHSDWVKLWPLQ